MQEVDLENMLARYPELIEPRLTLIDRQHCINRKRVDLLYSDSTGRTLVVEVKVGALCRTDIGQLSEYCHYFFQRDGTRPRGMLVGTRVPDEIRGAAGFNGFECISLSLGTLEKHMRERNDQEMLSAVRVSRSSTSGSESHEVAPNTEHRGFWSRVLGRWAAVNTTSPTPRTYAGAKPSIADMLRSVLSEVAKGAILSAHEINSAVLDAFPGTPKSAS